jgi:hypothetical protein
LFEQQENLPVKVQKAISLHTDLIEKGEEDGYALCKTFQNDIRKMGYTFEYGLDGVPYNLQKYKKTFDQTFSPN